jgi:NTE family protein
LPFAQHVLVVGSIHAPGAVRDLVASLPMDAELGVRPALAVVLTDAGPGVIPTDATLEGLTGLVGAPVRGVIPASGERQHAAIDALARWVTGQRVGLALGGGGAKGWAHLGVLRVLARANVPVDCIAGASIGAMVAASVACGTPPDAIERQMAQGSATAFRPLPTRAGLLSSRGIARFLRSPEAFGDRTIEDLPTPLAIVATDLHMGREIVIRRGPIWQAVLASAALPAFFPPVRIGGNTLVDGGVVNPVPVSAVQLLGADKVIAVDISASLNPREELADARHTAQRVPGMLTNILRSLDIMAAQIRAHAADEPGIRIKPELAAMSLRQFRNGAPLIEAGEAAAEAALPELIKELPWLRRP